jgi:hypothetical protein
MQEYGCINMFPITEMERKNGYFYQNQGSESINSSMKKIIPIVSILLLVVLQVTGQKTIYQILAMALKSFLLG